MAVVVTAALYLLTLGSGALVRPELTKRFLGGFATTPRMAFWPSNPGLRLDPRRDLPCVGARSLATT